jgi:hypothetical protein
VTAEEAIAEVGQVSDRLRELDEKLRQTMSGAVSAAIPQLLQEMARKQWLLAQIQRMQKAGS